MSVDRMDVRLLPDAPLSDDTEFAFIDGRTFVNATKHEEVVDHHVTNLREAVEALEALGHPNYGAKPTGADARRMATFAREALARLGEQ